MLLLLLLLLLLLGQLRPLFLVLLTSRLERLEFRVDKRQVLKKRNDCGLCLERRRFKMGGMSYMLYGWTWGRGGRTW